MYVVPGFVPAKQPKSIGFARQQLLPRLPRNVVFLARSCRATRQTGEKSVFQAQFDLAATKPKRLRI